MVSSETLGVVLSVYAMLSWGSWGVFFKAATAKGIRVEVFFVSFSLGCVVFAVAGALLAKEALLPLEDIAALFYAAAAGSLSSIASILLCASMKVNGLALAFPAVVGTEMILGTVLLYLRAEKGDEDPYLLFGGVAAAALAVFFDVLAAAWHKHAPSRLRRASSIGASLFSAESGDVDDLLSENLIVDAGAQISPNARRRLTCAAFAALSGIIFSTWPLLAQIDLSGPQPRLSPYTFFFCLSGGFLFATVLVLSLSLFFPTTPLLAGHISGVGLQRSHISSPSLAQHALGIVGGIVWASGTLSSLVAANSVSLVTSMTIARCAPMVAAGIGVFFYREMSGSGFKAKFACSCMFLFYITAISFVAAAKRR